VKAFFDSSVLVAAFYGAHVHHAASLAAIQTASKKTASCAAHTLAEVYSVMTRLPVRPRISPEQGLLFIESIRERFTVVTLSDREYYEVIAAAAGRGIGGGKIYDALILRCAEKSKAEAIYTWNLDDFSQIADAELAVQLKMPGR
jgi:predicted nucleic acid-binding protein